MGLLHLGRVLADCAVLPSAGLIEPPCHEYRRREGGPDQTVHERGVPGVAFQKLHAGNEDERAHENDKKPAHPEGDSHG